MRIWSVHPKYLDAKGLVALWRETLLARKVLEGKTKGYTNHPQLERFKNTNNPLMYIDKYLEYVFAEANKRGYKFDSSKFNTSSTELKLTLTNKQLHYEFNHLLNKLQIRNQQLHQQLVSETHPLAHPLFTVIDGNIEDWEIV